MGLARGGATAHRPPDAYADPGNNAPTSVDNYIPRDVNALVRNGYRVAVTTPARLGHTSPRTTGCPVDSRTPDPFALG